LDVLHYKVLRVAVNDWGDILPRDMLYTLGRALLLKFATCFLGTSDFEYPGYQKPFDAVKTKLGKHFNQFL